MYIHKHTRPQLVTLACWNVYIYIHKTTTRIYPHAQLCMPVSAESAPSPKSTGSRNSGFLVSRGTNSNWDFGLIWNCTEEFEFLDSVNFGGVAMFAESVICTYIHKHTKTTIGEAIRFECIKTTTRIYPHAQVCTYIHTKAQLWMPVSAESAPSPKSTEPRNFVFFGNSWCKFKLRFCLTWNCTEKFEFLESVDFGGVAMLAESVRCTCIHTNTHNNDWLSNHVRMHQNHYPYLSARAGVYVHTQTHNNTPTGTHTYTQLHQLSCGSLLQNIDSFIGLFCKRANCISYHVWMQHTSEPRLVGSLKW